jgi:hypothetical protein
MIGFIREFWAYMRARKKFWLLPVVLVLLLFGGLMILAEGSAIAPFIYTIF